MTHFIKVTHKDQRYELLKLQHENSHSSGIAK